MAIVGGCTSYFVDAGQPAILAATIAPFLPYALGAALLRRHHAKTPMNLALLLLVVVDSAFRGFHIVTGPDPWFSAFVLFWPAEAVALLILPAAFISWLLDRKARGQT